MLLTINKNVALFNFSNDPKFAVMIHLLNVESFNSETLNVESFIVESLNAESFIVESLNAESFNVESFNCEKHATANH